MPDKFYTFGYGDHIGNAEMTDILGGKGANLAEMSDMGIKVPMGFTIPTSACREYNLLAEGEKSEFLDELVKLALIEIDEIASIMGYRPLFSVRSGAPVSMPGMMDTILNVGISVGNLEEWINRLGPKAAIDCYRRLIQMYGTTVEDIDPQVFDAVIEAYTTKHKVGHEIELGLEVFGSMTDAMAERFEHFCPFPEEIDDQLYGAIKAVMDSWWSERAQDYRELHNIPDELGTAVNIQMMVFGNMNDHSGSGVLFSRNPMTGENKIFGEFLVNAQGEDVVAGTATPVDLAVMETTHPEWYLVLEEWTHMLETRYRDMQDIEFTVQDGTVYLLQCRVGKRSAPAAFKIALDMVEAHIITVDDLKDRISRQQVVLMHSDVIDPNAAIQAPHLFGNPACGGVANGYAAFSSEAAVAMAEKGQSPILFAKETTPNDLKGMIASVGIVTMTGGATCHAAVVARSLDTPCIVGCTDMQLSLGVEPPTVYLNAVPVLEGDPVTVDGTSGRVWLSHLPLIKGGEQAELKAVEDLLLGDMGEVGFFSDKIGPGVTHLLVANWITKGEELVNALKGPRGPVVLDFSYPSTYCLESPLAFTTHSDNCKMRDLINLIADEVESILHQGPLQFTACEGGTAFSVAAALQKMVAQGAVHMYRPETVSDLLGGGVFYPPKYTPEGLMNLDEMNQLVDLLQKAGVDISWTKSTTTKKRALLELL